ncbi:MAG: hypothetical protein ACK5O2_05995 [Microthrixaceae bacterium]
MQESRDSGLQGDQDGAAGPLVGSGGHQRWSKWLVVAFGVTMLAGILFGYDQGVISGAIWRSVPETRGRSLEEIEAMLTPDTVAASPQLVTSSTVGVDREAKPRHHER